MRIDEIIKLNMKLGDDYLIIPIINDGWELIRNNKIGQTIMDSEHNSKEELKEFVKKYRLFDLSNVMAITSMITNGVIFVLCIVNLFIHSQFIANFNLGALLIIVIYLIVRIKVDNHNWTVKVQTHSDDMERLKKFQKELVNSCLDGKPSNKKTKGLMSDLKKNEVKSKTIKTKIGTIKGENTTVTRKKVSSTKTSTKKPKNKVEEKKDI